MNTAHQTVVIDTTVSSIETIKFSKMLRLCKNTKSIRMDNVKQHIEENCIKRTKDQKTRSVDIFLR